MTSTKPQVNFRIDLTVKSELDELAKKLGLTSSELAKRCFEEGLALTRGASPIKGIPRNDSSVLLAPGVCVCIGDRLDTLLLLEPHIKDYINSLEVLVFPLEQIVAVVEKSSNGNRKYLKVAKVYSDIIWKLANLTVRSSEPVAKLETILDLTKSPIFLDAVSIGFKPDFFWSNKEVLKEAKDYLDNQVPLVNSQELDTTTQLTRDAFTKKYNLPANSMEYAVAVNQAKTDSYLTDDNYYWTCQGTGKSTLWSGTRLTSQTLNELQVAVG